MQFCVTYHVSPPRNCTFLALRHVMVDGQVKLFDTQRKAYRWIVRHGLDDINYAVDPWHDLAGRFSRV